MDETFDEYRAECLEDTHVGAQIDGTTFDDWFFTDSLSKLENMGEITDPQFNGVYKKGRNGRIMSFDAYAFDESDKSIVLITKDFADNLTDTLTKSDIEKYKARMLNFLEEAYDGKLSTYFDTYDDMQKIGSNIGQRMHIDYVSTENDQSIDKIKLYIVTNKSVSDRITSLSSDNFLGKKVDLNVWGLQRFYDLYKSGRDREAIVIKTEKYGFFGIPCIKAEMNGNLDYDAYLAIIPGQLLNDIYYEFGSRLLEGNVRAFLSVRGKINKGIRETIRKEPTKFFTYNNGIACTASNIKLSDDGRNIVEMEDLQIINGGQTTASLTSAVLKDHLSLNNIFVPMKLTVVKDDDYETMIQNISKYANSQNKVTDADLFSNHPFHRAFEALSKKIQAPAKSGELNGTYWYYERSRGKYEQEQFKFQRKSEKEAFIKKFPRNQVIKKEELAKYYNAAVLLRPDLVCKGSQKSMNAFAVQIDAEYQKSPEIFNEEFYKLCICYTILYRTTDYIVSHAPWYNVGGYKLNIVPYTVSKLISLIPSGKCLDYINIWKKQELYPSLFQAIQKIAPIANEFITNSNGVIVTEYCKHEDTWKKYKEQKIDLDFSFFDDLISESYIKDKLSSSKKDEKLTQNVNILSEIYNLGSDYWTRLKEEGIKRRLLSSKEIDLLNIAISLGTSRPRVPSDRQANFIWKIREKLDKAGVLV